MTGQCNSQISQLFTHLIVFFVINQGSIASSYISSLPVPLPSLAVRSTGATDCTTTGTIHSNHYFDVIISAMVSQIFSLMIVCSIVHSGTDQRNIKAPRHWPLCGEFIVTGDRWIPRTNDQQRGKCFYLMTSSCVNLCYPRQTRSLPWGFMMHITQIIPHNTF